MKKFVWIFKVWHQLELETWNHRWLNLKFQNSDLKPDKSELETWKLKLVTTCNKSDDMNSTNHYMRLAYGTWNLNLKNLKKKWIFCRKFWNSFQVFKFRFTATTWNQVSVNLRKRNQRKRTWKLETWTRRVVQCQNFERIWRFFFQVSMFL